MRLSIITPTIGRPTLLRTVREVQDQRDMRDEHIVVFDGPNPELQTQVNDFVGVRTLVLDPAGRHYGAPATDLGIRSATGDYLWCVNDDDVPAPLAIATIKKALSKEPGVPHIFCMVEKGSSFPYHLHRFYGKDRFLMENYIGNPMLVFPYEPELANWSDMPNIPNLDWHWLSHHLERFKARGLDAVWHDEVIYWIRPD